MVGPQQLAADRVGMAVEGVAPSARTVARSRPSMAATSCSLVISAIGRDGDGAAVAHDRHPVADGIELVELVADEDHRHALALELADDVEQHRDLVLVEGAGGLVHDHELGLERRPRGRSPPSAGWRC